MRYFILMAFIVLPISFMTAHEGSCIRAGELAKKDMYNKELKYYRFGLMAAGSNSQVERKVLKDVYNIELIQLGCVVSDSILCYNEMADKIIERKYGKDFWENVNLRVNSYKTSNEHPAE